MAGDADAGATTATDAAAMTAADTAMRKTALIANPHFPSRDYRPVAPDYTGVV
ncbi:hypothetical protein GCM10023148_03150 [Actinokineospora soli]